MLFFLVECSELEGRKEGEPKFLDDINPHRLVEMHFNECFWFRILGSPTLGMVVE